MIVKFLSVNFCMKNRFSNKICGILNHRTVSNHITMDYGLMLTWTLDETTDNLLTVGKDLMRVATSDNVQPIALLACERFGLTITMCPNKVKD